MAAIIVPKQIDHHVRWSSVFHADASEFSGRTTSLLLSNVGVSSAYFPREGIPLHEFTLVISELEVQFDEMIKRGAKNLILGCDLNTPLPLHCHGVTGGGIFKTPTLGDAPRIDAIMNLLTKYNLLAFNTLDDANTDQCFTRISWGQRKSLTQIDFLFASGIMTTQTPVRSFNHRFCGEKIRLANSDHFPVQGNFNLGARSLSLLKSHSTMTGYKLQNNDDQAAFQKMLMNCMGFDGTLTLLQSGTFNFAKLEESIMIAARSVPYTTRGQRMNGSIQRPRELILAKRVRLSTAPGTLERIEARRVENRLKRKWKAKVAKIEAKKRKNVKSLQFLEIDGEPTVDNNLWGQEVINHCANKYTEDVLVHDNIEDVFLKAQKRLEDCRKLGNVDPPLLIGDVLAARASLQKGKAAGGGTPIVNEMVKLFPYLLLFVLWTMMCGRYDGSQTEVMTSWLLILVNFIPKQQKLKSIKHFRGVCLLETISKLYMAVLIRMVSRQFDPWKFIVCNFAYQKKLCTSHLILTVKLLLFKSYDWRGSQSDRCCVGIGDIAQAFDNARVCTLYDALCSRRLPPALIAAIINEFRRLEAKPIFQNLEIDMKVAWSKSIKQGGVEGPWCWNQIMAWIMNLLAPAWIQSGWGVSLGNEGSEDDQFRALHRPRVATHAIWSDNIFIFAKDRLELGKMMRSLTRVLASNGLLWKPGSLAYLQNSSEEPSVDPNGDCISFDVEPHEFSDCYLHEYLESNHLLDGPLQISIPRVTTYECLGTHLHENGEDGKAVTDQLLKAQNKFWVHKNIFKNKLISRDENFRFYCSHVVPVALHGCTVWSWTPALQQQLQVFENQCLRQIVWVQRLDNETWPHLYQRHHKDSSNL